MGELITDAILGKLNSVNTRSTDMLAHISVFPILENRDGENCGHVENQCFQNCCSSATELITRAVSSSTECKKEPQESQQAGSLCGQKPAQDSKAKKATRSPTKARRKSEASRAAPKQRNDFKVTLCPAGTAAVLLRITRLLPDEVGARNSP